MKGLFIGSIMLALCLWGPVQAQEAGRSEFEQGLTLFKKTDYRGALESFVAARKAGMDEPKLDFNLGVCYYKLGRYEQAREALLRAANHPPMRDLAHFNIGLVEEARSRTDEAAMWFQRVFAETDNAKIKALAEAKLGLGLPAEGKGLTWFGGYSASIGYDDNIEDPTLLGVADKGDSFTDLLLYGSVLLQGDYDEGLHLGGNLYLLRYQDIGAYDMNLLQVNLDKTFRSGEWRDTVGLGLEQIILGGVDFLRTAKLTLAGEKKLGADDEIRLRYRYSDVASLDPIYDKLEGNRHEAEVRWQRKTGERRLRASYEYEVNDRNDFQGLSTFSSYSPTRHTLELRAYVVPAFGWDLDGRLSLRRSIYADDNILAGGTSIRREDDRVLLGAKLSRTLQGSLKVNLDYKYTDNSSSIPAYDYTRRVYSLGLSGAF